MCILYYMCVGDISVIINIPTWWIYNSILSYLPKKKKESILSQFTLAKKIYIITI